LKRNVPFNCYLKYGLKLPVYLFIPDLQILRFVGRLKS
jgi:hypothetical protein